VTILNVLQAYPNIYVDYRHQEDETVASRGSIATKTAVLKTAPSGDKVRFEVHSTPSRGHNNVQKWYLKGMAILV
jgi:oxysterol-binding protein 1